MPLLLKDQSTRSVCGALQLFRTVPLSKSSLSTTFRGWTQTRGSTRHWWLSSLQPPTGTFHLWAQLFGVELRPEVQPPIDGFHLWTSLFRGWTHAHSNQYGIWRQLASINLLSTKQTVGIQTETEPISGSFTLREPKRTQTNQRLTALWANHICVYMLIYSIE